MRLLLRWLFGAIALLLTVKIGETLGLGLSMAPGSTGLVSALVVILALTLVNAFVRPILAILTAPLNCLTLGLFSFVLNALMFWLVGSLNIGLTVRDFLAALFGSLILSAISGLLNAFVTEKKDE
ncbi:MAG: phage holin family protein [Capsulimonadales bacterium]|nr:phage holin family protein [Capsulimonadales bacterium]